MAHDTPGYVWSYLLYMHNDQHHDHVAKQHCTMYQLVEAIEI